MAISIDSTMASYMATQAQNNASSAAADKLKNSVGNLSETTNPEEAKAAIKEFEKYFVEQMLKQMEEEFKDDKATFGQLTNLFMDQVNGKVAEQLIDQAGGRITQTLYEQMCRNYNIPLADSLKPPTPETVEDETVQEIAEESALKSE